MRNKTLTAVEWLIEQLTNRQNGIINTLSHLSLDQIYNQAKEMEKQQIINAWDSAYFGDNNHDGEQYYNENYEI
jgi:hypothetical protein